MRLLFRERPVQRRRRRRGQVSATPRRRARVPLVPGELPARRISSAASAGRRWPSEGSPPDPVRILRGPGPVARPVLQRLRRHARRGRYRDTSAARRTGGERPGRARGSMAVAGAARPPPGSARAPLPRAPRPRWSGRTRRERKAEPAAPVARGPRSRGARRPARRLVVDTVFVLSARPSCSAVAGMVGRRPRGAVRRSFLPVLASAILVPLRSSGAALPRLLLEREGGRRARSSWNCGVETEDGVSPLPLGARSCASSATSSPREPRGRLPGGRLRGSGLHDRVAGTRVVKGARR